MKHGDPSNTKVNFKKIYIFLKKVMCLKYILIYHKDKFCKGSLPNEGPHCSKILAIEEVNKIHMREA